MDSSGRRFWSRFLPLLLFLTGCTGPALVVEDVADADTCESLVPVGIELVNDYVYTLLDTDVGATGGDPEELPTSIVALNARGAELDERAAQLGCDVGELNLVIAAATEGIESSNPAVRVFLEAVRSGVVGTLPAPPPTTTTAP